MGAKPSKQTVKDKRLKANKPKTATAKRPNPFTKKKP